MFLAVVAVSLYFTIVCANFPSIRIVYYLHSHPATWASARDTCARYGGHLVHAEDKDNLEADVDILDTLLDWNGQFASITGSSNVWTGLHRIAATSGGDPDTVMWHKCENFTEATSPNDNIATEILASAHYCASMDGGFKLVPEACDTELPYICQISEGQCWFLPVEDRSFQEAAAVTSTGDLNTCAQMCRNNITQTGTECWGFVAENGLCKLYRNDNKHAYIRDIATYLQDDPGITAYLKICAGGDPTTMKPVTNDQSIQPRPDNCTRVNSDEDWDSGVCYCDCDQPPVILDPEYLALSIDEKVVKIVKELKVDPKGTSSTKRKLNSAEDDRPSAQSIGAVGIAILSVVFGGLVLLDLDVLISHIGRIICRSGEAKKQEQ